MDEFADLWFPTAGLHAAGGFGDQPINTTRHAINVRAVECLTSRVRGGSRPGMVRFADESPAGSVLIQHLAIIIDPQTAAQIGAPEAPPIDPVTGLPWVADPSDPGPPGWWGGGPIVHDPSTGLPVDDPDAGVPYSGETEHTRNPGGPGSTGHVSQHHVRQGGSAWPTPLNIEHSPDPARTPRRAFTCYAVIRVIMPPDHDPFFFHGQIRGFSQAVCRPYQPPQIDVPDAGFALAMCQSQIDDYMTNSVGPYGDYEVVTSYAQGPGPSCTQIGAEGLIPPSTIP